MNKKNTLLIERLEAVYKYSFLCPICCNSNMTRQELSTAQFKKLLAAAVISSR